MSQDIRKTGLLAQADEAQAQDAARDAVGRSNALVNIGLALSALLSVLYITLALGPGLAVPAPFNYVLAVFVGIVSIVPAELAIYIWRARLQGDVNITGAQRAIAAVCMVLAGISAAVTTMSFFGWALASLFPAFWLDAQPVANLGAILGAWLVFILGSIGYDTTSVTTRLNLQMANAMNRIHRTRANLIKSAAQAIGNETDTLVSDMDAAHLFAIDAQAMIADLLGLDAGRASAVGQIAASRQTIPQPPEDATEDGAPDWPRLIADMGLTEDDLRQAVAYGRQARQADDLAIDDLQREIDARQRREEAERLANIRETVQPARPTTRPTPNGHGRA